MGKEYREDSRMGRALDALIRKGIDSIKIIPKQYIGDETVFLALGTEGDGLSFEGLCKICDSIHIHDMEISPNTKTGEEIKNTRQYRGLEPNPKYRGINLKLEDGKHYNVVGIKYVLAEIGITTSRKCDLSYLKPSA